MLPLQFSGMETMLIALLTAVVSCFGLFFTMAGRFMSRKECRLQHQNSQSSDDALKNQITDLAKTLNQMTTKLTQKQDLQFRMIRELIIHSDLPQDKKAKILNLSESGNG